MSRSLTAASSQYIEVGSAARTGWPVTLAAWFRLGTPQSFGAMLALGHTSSSSFCVLLGHESGDSKVRAFLQSGTSGVWDSTSSSTTVGALVWAHGALTCDGTTLAVYLNGAGKTTTPQTVGFPPTNTTTAGRMPAAAQNFWDGRVAEAAVWGAALSDAEVAALASGASPSRVRPGALALYWPLWAVQSPEIDLSGGGRHGTVTGAAGADHSPTGRTP